MMMTMILIQRLIRPEMASRKERRQVVLRHDSIFGFLDSETWETYLFVTDLETQFFLVFLLLSHWLSEGKVYSSGICMYFSPNLVLPFWADCSFYRFGFRRKYINYFFNHWIIDFLFCSSPALSENFWVLTCWNYSEMEIEWIIFL